MSAATTNGNIETSPVRPKSQRKRRAPKWLEDQEQDSPVIKRLKDIEQGNVDLSPSKPTTATSSFITVKMEKDDDEENGEEDDGNEEEGEKDEEENEEEAEKEEDKEEGDEEEENEEEEQEEEEEELGDTGDEEIEDDNIEEDDKDYQAQVCDNYDSLSYA